jgi:hypothetical protein
MGGREMDLFDLGWGQGVGSCEHGDGNSWEYLDLLKNYQFLKKYS